MNEMHQRRDSKKSKAIKFFHPLIGYNKVFSLSGYSKKNSCKTKTTFPEATDLFAALSKIATKENYKDAFPTIGRCIVILYSRSSNSPSLNK